MITLKEIFTAIRHPTFIFRNPYPVDKRVENLIKDLIAHKDKCTVCIVSLRMYITYKDNVYGFWIANKFYAFLSNVIFHKKDEDFYPCYQEINNIFPKRLTVIRFYHAFYEPMVERLKEEERLEKEKKKKNFLPLIFNLKPRW